MLTFLYGEQSTEDEENYDKKIARKRKKKDNKNYNLK